MPQKFPLATLIELAQKRNDEAARRLGQLQNAHLGASRKLEMLQQYRQEYVNQLDEQMRQGVPSAHVRNFQHFIGTLDGAIEQQRTVTQQADTRLGHGRSDWQHSKRQLTSFDALAERARQHEALASYKKEQRDSDERAARQFHARTSAAAD